MSKAGTGALIGAMTCAIVCNVAAAADIKAGPMVSRLEKAEATLLAEAPALARVDNAIRTDCSAKSEGQLAGGDFCSCAAAVTMGIWRSGSDPKMGPRLNAYLSSPTEAGAQDLLQYQGPELYGPFCAEALRR